MLQRYGKTIWNAAGVAAGLYLLGARGQSLLKYTAGAMAGAWAVNLLHASGQAAQPPVSAPETAGEKKVSA